MACESGCERTIIRTHPDKRYNETFRDTDRRTRPPLYRNGSSNNDNSERIDIAVV